MPDAQNILRADLPSIWPASNCPPPDDRVFPLCYTTARNLVSELGKKLNVKISLHDLLRHSATYASRNGVQLEIISTVILRHQDLKITQIYLGKISDTEAIRWMDILHGKWTELTLVPGSAG